MQFLHHLRHVAKAALDNQRAHFVMGEAGAFAHRLGGTFARVFIAQADREQCLDQTGARPATGRCLAGGAHGIKGACTVCYACCDLTLADAVAAAHFRIIGKRRNGGLRVRLPPSRGKGLAKNQRIADLGHVFGSLEQIEIPVAVGGIAIEHRTYHAVVFHHDTLVDPT